LAVDPLKAGSREKRSSRASIALGIGIPIVAIFTALILGIYCIKKQRKSSMHEGTIVIFLISIILLFNKLVTLFQFLVKSTC
jgi:hypothetical protein